MKQNFWEELLPNNLWRSLPQNNHTILDLFRETIAKSPQLPAFSMEDLSITFHELDIYSDRLAQYLLSQADVQKGDRILVQLPNIIAFPIAVFAAFKAGLIVVPCNPLYTPRETLHIIRDCSPKIAVGLCFKLDVYRQAKIPHIIGSTIFDTGARLRAFKIKLYSLWEGQFMAFKQPQAISLRKIILKPTKLNLSQHPPAPSSTALLKYTGGSTGVIKGAQLTHANIVSNVEQLSLYLGSHIKQGQEIAITILPLYHIFSFTVHCMMGVFTSNHIILIPNPTKLGRVIKQMEQWPFTTLSGLNTLFCSFLTNKAFKQLDFSHLKLTISGGMRLDPEVAQKWQDLTKCPIIEGFGMSETSPVISLNHPKYNELETVGYPLPQTQIKIVLPNGLEAESFQEEGEIYVRGPQVSSGYWHQEDENKVHFTSDHWLRTGDIGMFLASGHLKITGRKKNMIIVSVFNVYPREVGEVLQLHPRVMKADVFGVAHKISGEAVHARLYVDSDHHLQTSDIKKFCRLYLASYKVPRKIELISQN